MCRTILSAQGWIGIKLWTTSKSSSRCWIWSDWGFIRELHVQLWTALEVPFLPWVWRVFELIRAYENYFDVLWASMALVVLLRSNHLSQSSNTCSTVSRPQQQPQSSPRKTEEILFEILDQWSDLSDGDYQQFQNMAFEHPHTASFGVWGFRIGILSVLAKTTPPYRFLEFTTAHGMNCRASRLIWSSSRTRPESIHVYSAKAIQNQTLNRYEVLRPYIQWVMPSRLCLDFYSLSFNFDAAPLAHRVCLALGEAKAYLIWEVVRYPIRVREL